MRVSPRLGSGKPLGSWRAEVAGLCVFRRNAGSSERAGGGVCPRPGYCLPGWRWRSWLSPCGWPPATVPIHAGFAADGQRRGGVARSMGSGRAVTARAAGWHVSMGPGIPRRRRAAQYSARAGSSGDEVPRTIGCGRFSSVKNFRVGRFLRAEGRPRTLSGPSPEPGFTTAVHPSPPGVGVDQAQAP
jgi:hypothetical protein